MVDRLEFCLAFTGAIEELWKHRGDSQATEMDLDKSLRLGSQLFDYLPNQTSTIEDAINYIKPILKNLDLLVPLTIGEENWRTIIREGVAELRDIVKLLEKPNDRIMRWFESPFGKQVQRVAPELFDRYWRPMYDLARISGIAHKGDHLKQYDPYLFLASAVIQIFEVLEKTKPKASISIDVFRPDLLSRFESKVTYSTPIRIIMNLSVLMSKDRRHHLKERAIISMIDKKSDIYKAVKKIYTES